MNFAAVLTTEFLKLRRSKVTWLSWLAYSFGPVVGGLFMLILRHPERARQLGLIGQKAQLTGGAADWPTMLGVVTQMTGVGGMILVSVIAAYVFGREYAEGTAKNMLALPVSRGAFAVAKLLVVAVWFAVLTVWVLGEGFLVGAAVGLPGLTGALAWKAVLDTSLVACVTLMLVPPVAWIATLGRGYLPPLGFAIMMLVFGNVFAATGWGKWFPWSIVPLYAGVAGPRVAQLPVGSFAVLAATFAAGVGATVWWLRNADNVQ